MNALRTHDLCDTGALLYQLSYKPTGSWPLCEFVITRRWGRCKSECRQNMLLVFFFLSCIFNSSMNYPGMYRVMNCTLSSWSLMPPQQIAIVSAIPAKALASLVSRLSMPSVFSLSSADQEIGSSSAESSCSKPD